MFDRFMNAPLLFSIYWRLWPSLDEQNCFSINVEYFLVSLILLSCCIFLVCIRSLRYMLRNIMVQTFQLTICNFHIKFLFRNIVPKSSIIVLQYLVYIRVSSTLCNLILFSFKFPSNSKIFVEFRQLLGFTFGKNLFLKIVKSLPTFLLQILCFLP